MTIDFRTTPDLRQHKSGNVQGGLPERDRPRTGDGKLLTPKQIRARARRKAKRHEMMTEQEMAYLYEKPVDEWDMTELAQGRPRNSKGTFTGPKPKWITAETHELAMQRYTAAVKTSMQMTTVDALDTLKWIINNNEVDDKGKPMVPASTKLDAAKFLVEHVVGKPTQRIESDVSVKLQGILGQVMVNPSELGAGSQYELAHYPGITMPLAVAADDDDLIEAEIIDES